MEKTKNNSTKNKSKTNNPKINKSNKKLIKNLKLTKEKNLDDFIKFELPWML